jgi:hypothetical protein
MNDLYDDYEDEDDELDDDGEWQPGECDRCYGGPPVEGPLGTLYCACKIGQGAPLHKCLCGPED